MDEADVFYFNPNAFIKTYFSSTKNTLTGQIQSDKLLSVPNQDSYKIREFLWPTKVVLFEALLPNIIGELQSEGYVQ
ncbi:hypothetical protein HK100_004744, partial [Physocladia obscura]